MNCLVILEFVHLSTTCQFLDFMMARIYDGYNLSGVHVGSLFVDSGHPPPETAGWE